MLYAKVRNNVVIKPWGNFLIQSVNILLIYYFDI